MKWNNLGSCPFPHMRPEEIVTPFTYEPIGVAVACNDPLLVNWLENLMKNLDAMGEMKEMKARWFESASWIKDLP